MEDARVEVREVGPRDGLQSLSRQRVSPDRRVRLVRNLAACGMTRIEVGSCVSSRAVPQMDGTDQVIEAVASLDAAIEVLVVNEQGAKQALAVPCDALLVVVAATDSFSFRNVRMSSTEARRTAAQILELAVAAGRLPVANVSVAFGCPDEGRVPIRQVVDTVQFLVEQGFPQVYLSDTIGVANPRTIQSTLAALRDVIPIGSIGLHLHDTLGLGLVNALAGLEAGVRRFDASVGGIGGCPFAPGATGNIATEDLVHLLSSLDMTTGIDLDRLVMTARGLAQELNTPLPGHVARATRR